MQTIYYIGSREQIFNMLPAISPDEPGYDELMDIQYQLFIHFEEDLHPNILFIIYIDNGIAKYYGEVDLDNEEIQDIKRTILRNDPNGIIYDLIPQSDDLVNRLNNMQLGGKKRRIKRRRKITRKNKSMRKNKLRKTRKQRSRKQRTRKQRSRK